MALKTLSRRHQDIQIGDRQFRLSEFTLEELHYYLDQIQAIAPAAVEALGDAPAANYHKALEVSVAAGEQLMIWLLRNPIDGRPAPDAAWYRANVTVPIQRDVQAEVYELNNLEQLLGEVGRLLTVATQQTQTGSTSSTPPPTDTAPTR